MKHASRDQGEGYLHGDTEQAPPEGVTAKARPGGDKAALSGSCKLRGRGGEGQEPRRVSGSERRHAAAACAGLAGRRVHLQGAHVLRGAGDNTSGL